MLDVQAGATSGHALPVVAATIRMTAGAQAQSAARTVCKEMETSALRDLKSQPAARVTASMDLEMETATTIVLEEMRHLDSTSASDTAQLALQLAILKHQDPLASSALKTSTITAVRHKNRDAWNTKSN